MSLQFLLFVIAGTTGFVADALLTILFIKSGLSHILSRGLAIPLAMTLTFFINKKYTFKSSRGARYSIYKQFFDYVLANAISQSFNFMVYTILILNVSLLYKLPILAVAVSSLSAMFITFGLSKYWVFKEKK